MSAQPLPPGAPGAPPGSSGSYAGGAAPGVDLNSLLVSTAGWDQKRLKVEAGKLYDRYCQTPARLGQSTTHDGVPVKMFDDVVDHAFRSARSRERRGWAKDDWDARRVERVRWIIPVIRGLVDGTDCYLVTDHQSPDNPKPQQRLYVVKRVPYVVWLMARSGGWAFKTAYVTSFADVKRYTSAKSRPGGQPPYPAPELIWRRP